MNRLLVIFRHAPYTSAAGQEGLDAVLAACALELQISVLFMDDGVFLLKNGRTLQNSELRDYSRGFRALRDFGVQHILTESNSMAARGLTVEELTTSVDVVNSEEVSSWIRQQDQVLTF